jgi:hypothetical protein
MISGTLIVAVPAPAAGQRTTKATIFRAFTPDGVPTIPAQSRSGYCFTGSLTINRRDAWRCFVGNYIYDPCFSSPNASGVVICPNLQVNGGISIRLTRTLPRQYADPGAPSLRNQPWNIQLASGRHCAFASGASNVIHGLRLNYFCGSTVHFGLWGFPNRRAQPWTILTAPFTATSVHQRRTIRHVWM